MGMYTSSTARLYLDHSLSTDNVTVKVATLVNKHVNGAGYTAGLEITSTSPGGNVSKQEVMISMDPMQMQMLANSMIALAAKLREHIGEEAWVLK